jgi:hypothetical protein
VTWPQEFALLTPNRPLDEPQKGCDMATVLRRLTAAWEGR